MATIDIPRAEWGAFFHSFNRIHDGWLCSLEVVGSALGGRTLARDVAFAGVSTDRGAGEPPIHIALGSAKGPSVSHWVDGPTRIRVRKTPEGADEALEIEAGAMTTLITFRVAALPETVDGVA
jgi:hypothetical protein